MRPEIGVMILSESPHGINELENNRSNGKKVTVT